MFTPHSFRLLLDSLYVELCGLKFFVFHITIIQNSRKSLQKVIKKYFLKAYLLPSFLSWSVSAFIWLTYCWSFLISLTNIFFINFCFFFKSDVSGTFFLKPFKNSSFNRGVNGLTFMMGRSGMIVNIDFHWRPSTVSLMWWMRLFNTREGFFIN